MLVKNIDKETLHEAYRWFRNGDHPKDKCEMVNDVAIPYLSDGMIVRRTRFHENASQVCPICKFHLYKHGDIINATGAHQVVCPGDWVVETTLDGEPHFISVSQPIFTKVYEEVK